MDFAECIA